MLPQDIPVTKAYEGPTIEYVEAWSRDGTVQH